MYYGVPGRKHLGLRNRRCEGGKDDAIPIHVMPRKPSVHRIGTSSW
jgi:hypothetical protein